jgi:hypothetical protein
MEKAKSCKENEIEWIPLQPLSFESDSQLSIYSKLMTHGT